MVVRKPCLSGISDDERVLAIPCLTLLSEAVGRRDHPLLCEAFSDLHHVPCAGRPYGCVVARHAL